MAAALITHDCAFAFPETSFPKFSSDKDSVTVYPLSASAVSSQQLRRHKRSCRGRSRTIRLLSCGCITPGNLAFLFQVDMPALCRTRAIL